MFSYLVTLFLKETRVHEAVRLEMKSRRDFFGMRGFRILC